MKEVQLHQKDEIKIHASNEQSKGMKYMGTLTVHPGHTCFELNLDTRMIDKATFQEVAIDFNAADKNNTRGLKKKLVMKDNCIYCTALNVKNADKKFRKMLGVDE